jgi:hypothetical protein
MKTLNVPLYTLEIKMQKIFCFWNLTFRRLERAVRRFDRKIIPSNVKLKSREYLGPHDDDEHGTMFTRNVGNNSAQQRHIPDDCTPL